MVTGGGVLVNEEVDEALGEVGRGIMSWEGRVANKGVAKRNICCGLVGAPVVVVVLFLSKDEEVEIFEMLKNTIEDDGRAGYLYQPRANAVHGGKRDLTACSAEYGLLVSPSTGLPSTSGSTWAKSTVAMQESSR